MLAFALLTAAPALGATNLYLNTGTGETACANNQAFPGYFPLSSFTFGGADPKSATTTGGGPGKISLQNLVIAKSFDNCSAMLITQFLQGRLLPTVKLIETQNISDYPAKTVLSITLTNAIVNSYSLAGSSGGGVPTEQIGFSYQKACVTSSQQNEDGSLQTPTTVCYNAETGVVTT